MTYQNLFSGTGFDISSKLSPFCTTCQNFSGTDKKNIMNLSFTELAQTVVKVNFLPMHRLCTISQVSLIPGYENGPKRQKTYFGHVCYAKIQIILRIRTVRSESPLGTFWVAKNAVSSCGERRL